MRLQVDDGMTACVHERFEARRTGEDRRVASCNALGFLATDKGVDFCMDSHTGVAPRIVRSTGAWHVCTVGEPCRYTIVACSQDVPIVVSKDTSDLTLDTSSSTREYLRHSHHGLIQ